MITIKITIKKNVSLLFHLAVVAPEDKPNT